MISGGIDVHKFAEIRLILAADILVLIVLFM